MGSEPTPKLKAAEWACERNSIKETLKRIHSDTEVVQLILGDILICKGKQAVMVERKTVTDFITSIRNNRLWDQLLRMIKCKTIHGYNIKRYLLLVHGSFTDHLRNLPVFNKQKQPYRFWRSIAGAYLEVIFVYGIPILYAENDDGLDALLRILIQRESEGKNKRIPQARWFRKPASSKLPVKDRRYYTLSALPLIGESLSKALLDHFKNIAAVANATVEELQEVPKIGKKKAERIYEIFH